MGISDIWLITIIVNYMYRIKTYIDTYKAYADLGYIYNNKIFKYVENQGYNQKDTTIWFLYKFGKFLPIYNLYQSLVRNYNYSINAKENIKIFEECGIIEKMTKEEEEVYKKNSSGLTAIKLRRKLNRKRRRFNTIGFSDGSSIMFDYKDNIEEETNLLNVIEIIEVRGSLSKKSNEELIKIVYESHIAVVESIFEDLQSVKCLDEEQAQELINNCSIVEDKDKIYTSSLENDEKKSDDELEKKSSGKKKVRRR